MTIDTVKSFSDYAKIKLTLLYQLVHAKGFPCFRTSPRGKILIHREKAIEWLEKGGTP